MNDRSEELLISRIVEGEADDSQWSELSRLAETDASVWRRVAEAQRDQAGLRRLVDHAAAVADRIEAPISSRDAEQRVPNGNRALVAPSTRPASSVKGALADVHRPARPAFGSWGLWSGWAVAALVFIALALTMRTVDRQPIGSGGPPSGLQTSIRPAMSTQDAFDTYMRQGRDEGRVLSEKPRRVILDRRPAPDGEGFELIYLQQVVEKMVVPSLYQFQGQNERGQPALVRYEQPVRGEI